MKTRVPAFAALFLGISSLPIAFRILPSKRTEGHDAAGLYVGNEVCANCHEQIVRSYSRTPMALTSGPVGKDLVEGSFKQKTTSISYQIVKKSGVALLNYERSEGPALRGSQELNYFIGSGRRGHSYLSMLDGFLYESPVSYYSAEKRWDISPGYESRREMRFNRPVEPSCLYCHAGQVKPIEAMQNAYEVPPFAQAGIGCEQCHGPGGDHIKGAAALVNPAILAPARRDSVCEQCHLSGESRVNQPGKNLGMFRSGDLLSDYVLSFVYENKMNHSSQAISHVEAMAQSRCKLRSGDSMSCMSCHDPHFVPSSEDAAAYFRAKCVACHLKEAPSDNLKQHYANDDCRGCHMPKMPVASIRHTALTDHRIRRRPSPDGPRLEPGTKLVQFGTRESDQRGLALAYAELALQTGNSFYQAQAFRLLTEVLPQYSKDGEVLTRLGYLHQSRGELNLAASLYENALQNEPHQVAAQVNLGVIYAQRGQADHAMALWRNALASNPGLSEAGVNLAIAAGTKGEKMEARSILQRVLRFNPDFGAARELLRQME